MKKRIINSIKILVRFDDICPTMNYTEFQKALTVIEKYDIKPLLGIIPNCQDPELQIEAPHEDFWDFIDSVYAAPEEPREIIDIPPEEVIDISDGSITDEPC